jgi:hypothetical protein
MTPKPISSAYFVNPFPSVCVSVCVSLLSLLGKGSVNCIDSFVARQRLGEHVLAATNTRNNRRIVVRVIFCAAHALWKAGLWICLCIVAREILGKDVPTTTKNCWRRRFLCGPFLIKGESVGLCTPLSLLGNNSVKSFRRQRRNVEGVFSMRPVSYQRKGGNYFFPELLVLSHDTTIRVFQFFTSHIKLWACSYSGTYCRSADHSGRTV